MRRQRIDLLTALRRAQAREDARIAEASQPTPGLFARVDWFVVVLIVAGLALTFVV